MSDGFHSLRILDTRDETRQAATVSFDVPPSLRETFRWWAGQHVTLRFVIDGAELRRSNSISDTLEDDIPLHITVKRVRDRLVSNHINHHLVAGDAVEVMPPFGGFCLDTDSEPRACRTC